MAKHGNKFYLELPRKIFTDEYKSLSTNAKWLYAVLKELEHRFAGETVKKARYLLPHKMTQDRQKTACPAALCSAYYCCPPLFRGFPKISGDFRGEKNRKTPIKIHFRGENATTGCISGAKRRQQPTFQPPEFPNTVQQSKAEIRPSKPAR